MMEAYYGALDAVFAPLLAMPPVLGEMLVAIAITFVITLFYKFMVNQKEVGELRGKQQELQKQVRKLQKSNPEEANKHMNEMLKLNSKMMRMNMKPMFPTMIFVILLLPWMATTFNGQVALLPVSLPFFGADFGWLMWYFVISMPFTQIFRKLMGVM